MHVKPLKVRWFGATAIIAALVVAGLAVPPSAEAGIVGSDLVSNGGFENGVPPWTTPDGGVLSIDTQFAAGGAASLKVTQRTRTSSGPWQSLDGKLTPGSSYDISAVVRFDSGPDTKEFILTMAYADGYVNVARAVATRGQWTNIKGSFTISDQRNVAGARVFIETPWVPDPSADPASNLMDFRVDDVSLFEVKPSFEWTSSDPLIVPKPTEEHPSLGVKDPTVVFADGKYHVFMTTASQNGWSMATTSFTDWSEASAAPITYLADSPIGNGYTAAPQVFFFEPQGLWYLIYQAGDPFYSTTANIDDPMSWTAPRPLYPNGTPTVIQQTGGWLDFFNICDDDLCHLFATGDNGRLWRAQTSIEQFPNGFGAPELELQDTTDNIFEASMTYKLDGSDKYVTMIEAIGHPGRYFSSWIADDLAGPWTPLAATEADPFAGPANRTFDNEIWSKEQVSHGEMIRSGFNQNLTLDPCEPMSFLYQGVSHTAQAPDYVSLPYKLGLLTAVGDNPISDMCVDVEPAVSQRKLAGKVNLVVSVTNNDSSPVSLTVTSGFGTKTIADLAPGKTTSVTFNTRAAETSSGAISVNATQSGPTGPVSYERTIEYTAG
ncbi:MAG: carbohydrate binding domain-containing protein [Microbacterium sp.]|uniref:non-reducing end alpha-L-arabinofuranosidase family hydrolase n=1 Tax=Microbacterium sp. TaxID=51671 RepID=UPI001DFAAEE5|nr:non-reducing end alpha-L-arabinofuranosidase family hydrolase [Microbacterium sp.]MBW8762635.1 carbohydrate binding domain-containing protein [Microbacterium sp.]